MSFKFSKFVALVLALAVVLGFAGTATAQTDDPFVETFKLDLSKVEGKYKGVDPTGVEIAWWHNHRGIREEAVLAAVNEFNENNPWGIKVEAIQKGDYPDIYQAMLAGLQTGELPGVTVAYQNQAATYEASKPGSIVNIDDFVMDPVLGFGKDWTEQFFQGFLTSDVNPQLGGKRTGIAVYRSMEVLYYNADALKQMGYAGPPKSWEEFKEMACRYVREGLGSDGYQVRTDASFVAAATFAAGAHIYDAEKDMFTYDIPEAKVMPRVMQEMVQEGCAKLIAERFGDQNALATQAALFYTGSSSGIPFVLAAIKESGKEFELGIGPIPGYQDTPIMNVYGASNSVVASTPEKELASWLFLRWYNEPAQQAFWAEKSNYFPTRRDTAANLTEVFAANKPYEQAFNLLGNTRAEPPVAGYDSVRNLVTAAMNNILDGADVDEEFAKLNEEANRLLEENRPKM